MLNKHKENNKNKDAKINTAENENVNHDSNGVNLNQSEGSVETLKKDLLNYKDLLLRKAAEFENFKKRTDSEISNYIKYSSEHIVKQLIPVYDDLIRSVNSVEKGETKDFNDLSKGLKHISEKFHKVLAKEGVKEIDCLGKEFDVDLCDALLQIPKNDVKPNIVIEVVEKGYTFKDKVIKHAKVVVSTDSENENIEKNVQNKSETENNEVKGKE